jgi:NADH-quinone oxidoreductase subunit L
MADAHATHGHDSHGHDDHGHDAHGQAAHGGGHGHDDTPRRTPVPAWEPTPWAAIGMGMVVIAVVYFVGIQRGWSKVVQSNSASKLSAPGQPAK